jgi:hypothetical protein
MRLEPGQERAIFLEIVDEHGAAARSELVSIDAAKATMRLARASAAVAILARVLVRLAHPRLGGTVELPATAHKRTDDRDLSVYEVRFDEPSEVERRVLAHLDAIFDERRTVRAKPDPTGPIVVTLASASCGELASGVLINLSTDGLSMRIAIASEAALARVGEVSVTFVLPGAPRPIALPGSIRHRRPLGTDVQIGVEFAGLDGPDACAQRESIASWVFQRQHVRRTRSPRIRLRPPPEQR